MTRRGPFQPLPFYHSVPSQLLRAAHTRHSRASSLQPTRPPRRGDSPQCKDV